MEVCGRYFSAEMLGRIQRAAEEEPGVSRRQLARQVCEWLGWRSANGKLQEMSCRKALAELTRRGAITLAEPREVPELQRPSVRTKHPPPDVANVTTTLAELGEIEIVPVSSRYAKTSGTWNALMDCFHSIGAGPLCGAQIRYLIRSETCGLLGGLSFSSATWRLSARDDWIGWSDAARRANLGRVVCNSRFLIAPDVHVPHLASHILGAALRRLPNDWEERYGVRPLLVETFVDPRFFKGTSYKAANFWHVGQTAARSTPHQNGKISDGKKDIYLRLLRPNARRLLREEPPAPLCAGPKPEHPVDWAEEEFGRVALYDDRLKRRLLTLASAFFAQPGKLVPEACDGSKAKTKAAYRFFDNKRVNMQTLLRPHVESSLERIREHKIVLAVQDTTTLNYSAHRPEGAGPINTAGNDAVGLLLHDTLAFTVEGTPLGVLDAQCWARDPNDVGKRARRHDLPIEEKESMKWLKSYRAVAEVQQHCPDTTLVSVGDREADVYELFSEAAVEPSGPELLVRAERSRNRQVGGVPLWDVMAAEPVAGYREQPVPRKGPRRARVAKLAIRHAEVTLQPPRGKKLPPVRVWVVYACEVDYSRTVKSPLEWMLITTVRTETLEEASERLVWYARRWGIEVYHRTLKSGCRIKDRRLGTVDRLEACLAIDMVVAWRIYLLTKQSRETPDVPCDVYLSEDEWQALYAHAHRELPPKEPPRLRDAVRLIAQLGGYLSRGPDDNPGTTTTWRGLQRLGDIVTGFLLFKSLHPPRAGP